MGAESKKGEEGKQEAGAAVKNEEPKENKAKEEEVITQEIVLKVDMHCEACAKKVARSLRGFKGVEEVKVECKANKVVVKAAKEVDPLQLQDRVHKKSGRKVDILSPLPTEAPKPESNEPKPVVAEDPPKKQQAPPPPPPVTTVVLQVGMHCEACAQALRRSVRKISGVESVATDVANDRVTVKGVIENQDQLAQLIYKRTRKHASIIKEEEKDKPKPEELKGEGDQKDSEKKQGDGVSNKDGESGQGGDEHDMLDKFEHWPTKAYMDYYYAHAPQLFSDENPNACTVM